MATSNPRAPFTARRIFANLSAFPQAETVVAATVHWRQHHAMPNQFDTLLKSPGSKLCAIAAPGSGKTSRLLIPKANDVLSDPNIKPEEVLLLTFSRLSAQDLKHQTKTLDRVPRATTVHSFALSFLLSEDNHDIRSRVESILLDFEKEALLSDLKVVFPKLHKTQLRKMLEQFSAGWATQPHDNVFEENDDRRAFKAAVVNWLVEHQAAMMEEDHLLRRRPRQAAPRCRTHCRTTVHFGR